MTSGGEYADHGFVFAMPSGEPLQGTVVYKYDWLPTLKRLALPKIRLHDLRHSAATLWLEAGLPLKLVQELLGHVSMTITADVYSHILPAYRRQAAEVLAAHLERHGRKGLTHMLRRALILAALCGGCSREKTDPPTKPVDQVSAGPSLSETREWIEAQLPVLSRSVLRYQVDRSGFSPGFMVDSVTTAELDTACVLSVRSGLCIEQWSSASQ